MITPLLSPFFEHFIFDSLQQYFASFSTTYVHTSSPPSTLPTLGPGSPDWPKQLEGPLYSWVPFVSLKCAIVVSYNPDNAECARQASDRYCFTPTASTPEITLRTFRGAPTVLVSVQLSAPPNKVPLAEDLQPALEQLCGRREQEDRAREGAGGAPGDMPKNDNGILLILEGEAGVCVRVQNWYHRRRIVVTRDPEGWGALDEELSDGEWVGVAQSYRSYSVWGQ